ncbi:MAG: hypothetical protein DELT_00472 [Desulfovibrio sp.]
MFLKTYPSKVVHPNEIITLHELMLRWMQDPIEKICLQIHQKNLTQFVISQYLVKSTSQQDDEDRVHLIESPWHLDQVSNCWRFNRLALLKQEVEDIELNNPLYTSIDKSEHLPTWYSRCTAKNYRKIAPLLFYVNFMLVIEPIPPLEISYTMHVKKIIESADIISPSNCLPPPKKNWIIPEAASKPFLRSVANISPQRLIIDHEYLENLIQVKREQGIIDEAILCRILLEHSPNISGASVTRLIYNITASGKALTAAKRRGNRLKEKARKLPQF